MRDATYFRNFERELNELEDAGLTYDEAAPIADERARQAMADELADLADLKRQQRKEDLAAETADENHRKRAKGE